MTRRNLPRGYSLLEILVVMFIIGILAVSGAYYIQNKAPTAVKAVSQELAGILRQTQSLAINSGQQVYLRTQGGGGAPDTRIEWGFRLLKPDGTFDQFGPVQGSWVLSPQSNRYASVSLGAADLTTAGANPLPKDVPAIALHAMNNTTIWNTQFFKGGGVADTTYFFTANGTISQEFFIAVAGRRGQVYLGANLGLVMVSPQAGLASFVKANASDVNASWMRL
ncbi:MAG TPA: prepilin-type N-terminal cleavage/methylation domain-containing protein [Geothrix sp.]|jgi:prepilin-type N-terminal cleavage/methylation domain-containing protein